MAVSERWLTLSGRLRNRKLATLHIMQNTNLVSVAVGITMQNISVKNISGGVSFEMFRLKLSKLAAVHKMIVTVIRYTIWASHFNFESEVLNSTNSGK